MAVKDVRRSIEQKSTTNLRIGQELANITVFVVSNGHVPGGSLIETPDLTARCPEASYSRIERLVDEMGMLHKFTNGPKAYLIHQRTNEIVNGEGVSAMVDEELRRLANHVKKDPTVRQIVAATRNVSPGNALQGLFNGDFNERRVRLELLVHAIKNDPRVSQGAYGAIIFRRSPNEYCATPLAVQLYHK